MTDVAISSSPAPSPAPAAIGAAPPRRGSFARAARRAALATAGLGLLVAAAPLLPQPARDWALVAGLGVWSVALAVAAWRGLRRAWRRGLAAGDRAATVIGCVGIALAVLGSAELEVVRLVERRPALTWAIDWRVALSHAQTVARSGGVAEMLDYPGAPLVYHIGPAWLAGAVGHRFGAGVPLVLFGLVPALSMLAIVLAALRLLRAGGVRHRLAAAAIAAAIGVPAAELSPRGLYAALPAAAFDAYNWALGQSLMPNSFFALGVGLCGLVLLAERPVRRLDTAAGIGGTAALLLLKPQFFVGCGLLLALLTIERAVRLGPVAPRTRRLALGGAAALALALALRALEPAGPPPFGHPVLAPLHTGYAPRDLVTIATLLGLGAWAIAVIRGARDGEVPGDAPGGGPRGASPLLACSLGGLLLLALVLVVVEWPVRAEFVARTRALGWPTYRATSEQWNLAQALHPLRALTIFAALGALAAGFARPRPRALLGAFAVLVALPLPLVVRGLLWPDQGFMAVEDPGLYAVLHAVPRDGTLLVASDLADPSDDFKQGLNHALLSGYAGHAVYVANLNHHIFAPADGPARVAALRRFFATPWSAWHGAWLRRIGVTHVLVSDRCPPVWAPPSGVLRPVVRRGQWTAYAVAGARPAAHRSPAALVPAASDTAAASAAPRAATLVPRYGMADCFTGARPFPERRAARSATSAAASAAD